MHVAVVGDRQAVHAQLLDVRHQLGDPVGPVEQGVFAVGVEMDERHLCYWHGYAHELSGVDAADSPTDSSLSALDSSSRNTASSGTPRAWSSTKR